MTAEDCLRFLQTIIGLLAETRTCEDVADVIVEYVLPTLGTDRSMVTLVEKDGETLRNLRAVGYPPHIANAWTTFPISAPVPIADAIRTRTAVIVHSYAEKLARYPALANLPNSSDSPSLLIFPMLYGEQALGSIMLAFSSARTFAPETVAFYETVVQQCAITLVRLHLLEEEQQAHKEAGLQNNILERMARGESLDEVLTAIIHLIEGWLPDALCSVLRMDSDGKTLRHGAALGLPEAFTKAIDGQAIGPRAGSCGTAAYRREPVIVRDIATDPLWTDYRDAALSYDLHACWSTPIFAQDDTVLGTFAIYYTEPRVPKRQEQESIVVATHLASIVLEKYRAEQERERLEQQFLHAQKMEGVGRLAGGIAHDFNNLLSIILGYAEILEEGLPKESPLNQPLRSIQTAASRAASLTRQLLTFARKQDSEPKVLEPNSVLQNITQMLQPLLSENITLLLHLTEGIGYLRIDPTLLEQVLVNLLVNARDAMPEGGSLVLKTERVRFAEPQVFEHCLLEPGDYVCLSITDSGSGMTEATRTRAFEPFFSTKEVGKGTGLGLATCYGIVRQNGGGITLESTFGKGTTVRVYLPTVEAQEASAESVTPVVSRPGGTETVLVVEDEGMLRELTSQTLRQNGYTVLTAANGKEALHIAKTFPQRIHLLLTDIVMPQMGGRELATVFSRLHPEARLLYVSGYDADSSGNAEVSPSEVPLLQKPFSMEELLSGVRDALTRPPS